MDNEERTELLEQAQNKINEAIELIEEALEGTHLSSEASAYIIAHLNGWANGDNPYDSTAIPKLIEHLEYEDINKMFEDDEEEEKLEKEVQ